ncbi:hypothetical protein [Massilia phosphatilytica]
MSFEFNPDDTFDKYPNPYRFENIFLATGAAAALAGGIAAIIHAREFFRVHEDRVALIAVAVATLVLVLPSNCSFRHVKCALLVANSPAAWLASCTDKGKEPARSWTLATSNRIPRAQGRPDGVTPSERKHIFAFFGLTSESRPAVTLQLLTEHDVLCRYVKSSFRSSSLDCAFDVLLNNAWSLQDQS